MSGLGYIESICSDDNCGYVQMFIVVLASISSILEVATQGFINTSLLKSQS